MRARHRGRGRAAGAARRGRGGAGRHRSACRGTWGRSAASRRRAPACSCARRRRRRGRRCSSWRPTTSTCRRASFGGERAHRACIRRIARRWTYAALLGGRSIAREIDDDVALTPLARVLGDGARAEARRRGRARDGRGGVLAGRGARRDAVRRRAAAAGSRRDAGVASTRRSRSACRASSAWCRKTTSWRCSPTRTSSVRARWRCWSRCRSGRRMRARTRRPSTCRTSSSRARTIRSSRRRRATLDEGFRAAAHVLEATYFVPYVSIAPMEPRAAVAAWDGDRLTVWAGTQRPFGIRTELAQRFEIEESAVRVIAPEIGGGFGGKSPYPVAHEAARLAKHRRAAGAGRVHARRRDGDATMRPAAVITIRSGFMDDGKIVAWEYHGYHARRPAVPRPARVGDAVRRAAREGDDVHVRTARWRPGSYRSLGAAANHFAREVHIDEIAAGRRAGSGGVPAAEPPAAALPPRAGSARRRRTAGNQRRQPSGSGQGIAIGIDVGSYVATAVSLDVQGTEVRGGPRDGGAGLRARRATRRARRTRSRARSSWGWGRRCTRRSTSSTGAC